MLVVVKFVVLVTFKVLSVVRPEATVRVEPISVAPLSVAAPDTVNVPSTESPSFTLIKVESSELNEVPLTFIAPNTTEPVPLGTRLMLSFDLVPSMLLSLILIAGKVTPPVPDGSKTMSSFDLVALISLPENDRFPENKGEA